MLQVRPVYDDRYALNSQGMQLGLKLAEYSRLLKAHGADKNQRMNYYCRTKRSAWLRRNVKSESWLRRSQCGVFRTRYILFSSTPIADVGAEVSRTPRVLHGR